MKRNSLLYLLVFSIPAFAQLQNLHTEANEEKNRSLYNTYFDEAGQEFGVPSDILRAVAFTNTRWTHMTWAPGDTASDCLGMPRVYGIMGLWDNSTFGHSLREAAALINKTPEDLKASPLDNIRGAAALLRRYYVKIHNNDTTNINTLDSWSSSIARYSGIPQTDLADQLSYKTYQYLSEGYHSYGIELPRRSINLEPMREQVISARKAERALKKEEHVEGIENKPDYPLAIWRPGKAGYYYTSGVSHSFVVIHDMEGTYEAVVYYLQTLNDGRTVSIYYCINGKPDPASTAYSNAPAGEITQMVEEKYWAWHVVCWNKYMFGIEHEGYVDNPAWFTPEMYDASSQLVKYLCNKYGIVKDRNHIIGHNEWQNPAWVNWVNSTHQGFDPTCNSHTDPGIFWNWKGFMAKINAADTIPPEIVSVFPSGDGIPCYKDIVVTFNTAMDISSTNAAFSLVPNVTGTISWNSDNTVMRFHPSSYLPFSTGYTVTIDPSAKNISSTLSLNSFPYEVSFTTVPIDTLGPEIFKSYPLNNETNVSTKADVVVTMNEPVQLSSLASTVKFFDSENNSVALSNAQNDTLNDMGVVSFTPVNLNPNSVYTLKLYPGIKDYYGNASVDTSIVKFTTSADIFSQGVVIDSFETQSDSWLQPEESIGTSMIDTELTSFTISNTKKLNGTFSGKLSYKFISAGGAVVEAASSAPTLDSYSTIGIWINGDQSMNTLELLFSPGSQVVSFGPLSWRGWKYLSVPLSSLSGADKKLTSLIVRHDGANEGAIYIDDIQADAVVSTAPELSMRPAHYVLEQNYPNPFNPSTTIAFSIPHRSFVSIKIYDLLGREVSSLVDGYMNAGHHSVSFDAGKLSSGVYIYRLQTENYLSVKKMMILK